MSSYISRIKPNGAEGPEYKLKDEEIREVVQNIQTNKADKEEVTETDTTNSTPFLYRETPYEADRVFLDELVGGSVAWNQLVPNNDKSKSVTIGSYNYADIEVINNNISTPHFLFAKMSAKVNSGTAHFNVIGKDENDNLVDIGCVTTITTTAQYVYILCKLKDYMADYGVILRAYGTEGQVYSFDNLNVIDLTQMFGSTIADYVYSLEQATAGSGIAWLKSHGFFTKDYYPYNAGELISVKTSGKKYVGFNQNDEIYESGLISVSTGADITGSGIRSKNYNKCIGGEDYYLFKETMSSAKPLYVFWYDENKSFISNGYKESAGVVTSPLNARFFRLRADGETTSVIICINISKTEGTPKNGDYVPYEEHTYDISNIDLRGIPKLVNNELVYDGDIYESNGETARKFAEYTFTGDENFISVSVGRCYFDATSLGIKYPSSRTDPANIIANGFTTIDDNHIESGSKQISAYNNQIGFCLTKTDSAGSVSDLQTYLRNNPTKLVFEKATPTTETTDPYTNPQICDKDGTEEFIDNRTVPVPVGHNSRYANLPSMMDGEYVKYLVDKVENLDTDIEAIEEEIDSVEEDIKSNKTATGNPITLTDASETYVQGLTVELAPKQDLHGYDFPWVGGAGKNKLPLDLDTIKSLNTIGTWIGNAYAVHGVTYTINTDDGGNVTSIEVDGTAETGYNVWLTICTKNTIAFLESGVQYILSGCPNGGSSSTYCLTIGDNIVANYDDIGSGAEIPSNTGILANDYFARIYVMQSVSVSNLMFYPMAVEGNTKTSFAPYSNICPITGYTEVGVEDVGINQWDEEWEVGSITSNGSYSSTDTIMSKNFTPVFPNTQYYLKSGAGRYFRVCYYDENKEFLYRETDTVNIFTTPNNCYYIKITGAIAYGNVYKNDVSINYPSTDHDYHAYQHSQSTIPFSQTLYGGESDFVEGGTDDDRASVDLSSLTWTKDGNDFLSSELSVLMKRPSSVSEVANMLCECFDVKSQSNFETKNGSIAYFYTNSSESVSKVVVYLTDTSLQDFMTIVNGQKLVYEKATPTTLSTPPTELKLLQGINNITTNGTTITLDYIPNNSIGDAVKASEEYTDRRIAELYGMIEALQQNS